MGQSEMHYSSHIQTLNKEVDQLRREVDVLWRALAKVRSGKVSVDEVTHIATVDPVTETIKWAGEDDPS